MKPAINALYNLIAFFLFPAIAILHVATVILANEISGFWAAVFSFSMPVLSEIYWAISHSILHSKITYYCRWVIFIFSLMAVWMVLSKVRERLFIRDLAKARGNLN